MTKIGPLADWNVDKKPHGCDAAQFGSLHMEPTMCKKIKVLRRETGRNVNGYKMTEYKQVKFQAWQEPGKKRGLNFAG